MANNICYLVLYPVITKMLVQHQLPLKCMFTEATYQYDQKFLKIGIRHRNGITNH